MPFEKSNTLWQKANHKGQQSWNKGLTKEINLSVLKQSNSLKKHWQEHQVPKSMLGKHHSLKTKRKMSLARKGNRNANWKGGLTGIIRTIRTMREFYWWKKKIREKYGSTCQRCGNKEKPQTHHVYPMRKHPNKILDTKNGIILCEDCHKLEIKRKLEPQWVHY